MYHITRKYVTNKNARPQIKNGGVKYIVAHDTGNAGALAYPNHYNYFQNIKIQASAHTFIDDKYILEIIPLNEKAWHVRYDKDTRLLGLGYANDNSVGVELCFGGSINFTEAYKRYVWYFSYLCKMYKLNPKKHIIGHYKLDPTRKTDPINAFKRYGVTWDKFINDVYKEFAKGSEDELLEKAIVINAFPDMTFAEVLAKRLKAPIYVRGGLPTGKLAKEVYIVGGTKDGIQGDKIIMLSGSDRFDVAQAVKNYLK